MNIEAEVGEDLLKDLDLSFVKALSFFSDIQKNFGHVIEATQIDGSTTQTSLSVRCFDSICMGGTFDHIHAGHLLLLTQAALMTRKKMLIGVTGDALLKKKSYADIIQPFELRVLAVRRFLERLCGRKL